MPVALKATSSNVTHNRRLVGDALWERLAARIVSDHGLEHEMAHNVLNEAVNFLRLTAEGTERAYTPSRLVDIGWHTFILYTREYADFCTRVSGRFIHHVPNDEPTVAELGNVAETVMALKNQGFRVNERLWELPADCGGQSCYHGDCSRGK